MTDPQLSFFVDEQQPVMAPIRNEKIVRTTNPIFYQGNKTPIIEKSSKSRCINILSQNKVSTKLEVNQQFFDMLSDSSNNNDIAIVSFIGPRKIGKSFLVDCLVSYDQKAVNREMTRNAKQVINMPTRSFPGRNGEKILFFDCDSSVSNDTFLWVYFNSSVIVLNLNPLDRSGEEEFIKNLSFLQAHLDSDGDELSLPKLIILRRDSESVQFQEKEFLKRVEEYNLFQKDILTQNMRYPGSVTVKAKQILDVPESALNKSFLNDVSQLSNLIKSVSQSKQIKGNVLGSKILSLSLQPLTRSINKERKVVVAKIWDDVIETLSVGYYNFYILKYSEELQREFEDERPCDKYSLYKKLSSVKRRVDKKVQGFSSISGDPIFQKYRQKLNEKIQSKEKIIKEINRQKCMKENDNYCKMLFSQLNDSNCAQLIQKYCESTLDEQKTDVLLQNFDQIIKKRIKEMEKSKNPSKQPSTRIKQLQEELRRVQLQISEQKKVNVSVVAYDFNQLQSTIITREKQLQKLQRELENEREISLNKKATQSKDVIALERSIEELKQKTEKQQKEISALRAQRQKKAQHLTKQLQRKLQEEDDKLARLEEAIRKIKESAMPAKSGQNPAKNNSCCAIM